MAIGFGNFYQRWQPSWTVLWRSECLFELISAELLPTWKRCWHWCHHSRDWFRSKIHLCGCYGLFSDIFIWSQPSFLACHWQPFEKRFFNIILIYEFRYLKIIKTFQQSLKEALKWDFYLVCGIIPSLTWSITWNLFLLSTEWKWIPKSLR